MTQALLEEDVSPVALVLVPLRDEDVPLAVLLAQRPRPVVPDEGYVPIRELQDLREGLFSSSLPARLMFRGKF